MNDIGKQKSNEWKLTGLNEKIKKTSNQLFDFFNSDINEAAVNFYMKLKIKKTLDSELLIGFGVFIICSLLIFFLTVTFFGYDYEFMKNILVEAHGMLFDILVIAIFIVYLNKRFERKHKIERYKDEIDANRNIQQREIAFGIVQNIKTIKQSGYY